MISNEPLSIIERQRKEKTMSIITLLTDFGYKDGYVGAMKGVILSIDHKANIQDISHDIPPQDIQKAAFELFFYSKYFPKKTIHVVVVDPTVGTRRREIVAKTENYYYVAPDNGVLTYVLRNEKDITIREITNRKFFLPNVSHTFHGRDIFAPVAAHLSIGDHFVEIGPVIKDPVLLDIPEMKREGSKIIGRVISVDHFGNIITNITNDEIKHMKNIEITFGSKKINKISDTYASVKKGEFVALIGSKSFLEIARRDVGAEEASGLTIGDIVIVEGE